MSDDIRRELGSRNMSRRELARRIGVSEPYLRDRLNDELALSLNDTESIYATFGLDAGTRLAAIQDRLPKGALLQFPGVGGSADPDPIEEEQYAAGNDDSLPAPEDHQP